MAPAKKPSSWISNMLNKLQDDAMFSLIGRSIIYNVSWEDPRIDCELLDIGNTDTILMLTSGGCNVLDMALEGAAKVVAADLNPRQNALLELKCVAVKALQYEEFFALFAKSNEALFREVYPTRLRPLLSEPAREFWDENASFFKNLFWSGMSGHAAHMLVTICRAAGLGGLFDGAWLLQTRIVDDDPHQQKRSLDVWALRLRLSTVSNYAAVFDALIDIITVCTRVFINVTWLLRYVSQSTLSRSPIPTYLLYLPAGVRDCATLEEQREVFKRYAGRLNVLGSIMNATRRLWCPFIAVPANQLHLFEGNIVKVAAENLFLNTHIARDNYFYYGYLYGCYTKECCPRYLKEENWAALQKAVDHIDIQTGTLKEVASRYPDGYFSRYILLDHMDWMPHSMILDEWAVFTAKARPDVRFLWRSFADHQHIAPLKYLDFHADNVKAALAMLPDRVAMYNSTHLATLPSDVIVTPRTAFAPRASLCDDVNVLFHNWLHPISGGSHQERLESFYKGQAASYDAFRHRFLHGRVPMVESMPTLSGSVWVDLGGGTAANLEHFKAADGAGLGDIFKAVYVVDLCRPLIDVARARVEANGWEKTVHLVVGDATDPALPGLPKAGTVDVVTMSYSLTMIPDWQAALRNVSGGDCGGGGDGVSDNKTTTIFTCHIVHLVLITPYSASFSLFLLLCRPSACCAPGATSPSATSP